MHCRNHPGSSLYACLLLLATLIASSSAGAQANYVASEIPAPEWPDEIVVADMNGNGRQDILIPVWSRESGRELEIYLQQANGRYSPEPSRRVRIPSEVIAVALADVRSMPGDELLLFSSTAVYSLSSAIPTLSNNLQHLFDWRLVASVPDRRQIHFLPRPGDMTGNGHIDLLLPGQDDYALFEGQGNDQFELRHRFSTINTELDPGDFPTPSGRFSSEISINQRDGLIVRILPRSSSAFEDFVQDWRNGYSAGELLDSRQRIPAAYVASVHPDSNTDIVFMNVGNDLRAQVNVLSLGKGGPIPDAPQWQGPADAEGEYHLMDINGNGLDDVVRILEEDSDWVVYFHVNRDGVFNFDSPDQIMRFSGYDLRLAATDITGNGVPDLSINYYTIPVTSNLRNPSIVRTQLLYRGGAGSGGLFSSRPDSRLDENFSASNIRALYEPMHLQADINNNGRIDALYVADDGTLSAKAIDSNLRLASNPFWQYVPNRTIIGFDVRDMNGNGIPDIILHHSTATTVLISSP